MLEKVYRIQNNNLYLFSRNKEFLIFNSDTVRWVLIDKEELCFLNNFSQDNKFIQKYKNIYYNFICKGLIKLSKTTSSNNTMISYPRIVYFAVTDECNLQCSYCYANAKCNQTIINTDAANKIIENIIEASVGEVVFTGGEPFLLPQVIDYAKTLKKNKIKTSIITNGTLLQNYRSEDLSNFDRISISLDGPNESTNDITRGHGTFEIVLKNILYAKQIHNNIGILSTIGTHNVDNITEMVDFVYHDLKLAFLRFQFFFKTGRGKNKKDLSLTYNQMIDTEQKLLEMIKLKAPKNKYKEAIQIFNRQGICHTSCGAGKVEVFIDNNADVFPCRLLVKDIYKLGNLNKQHLRALYIPINSKSSAIGFSTENNAKCKNCMFKNLCGGGCRASHSSFSEDLHTNSEEFCEFLKSEIELGLWEFFDNNNKQGIRYEKI